MSSIFPFIDAGEKKDESLPLYRDIKLDDEGNVIFKDGVPVMCEGLEALKTWCYHALMTERKKHRCLSHGYGCDLLKLVGKPFLPAATEAEGRRYIKECIEASKYIKSVENIEISFNEAEFSASFKINTIYGRGEVNV